MTLPIVTDHAVVRYIERVKGFDVDAIRLHIAEVCRGIKIARCVRAEGHDFILRDGHVITVRPHNGRNPRKVPK